MFMNPILFCYRDQTDTISFSGGVFGWKVQDDGGALWDWMANNVDDFARQSKSAVALTRDKGGLADVRTSNREDPICDTMIAQAVEQLLRRRILKSTPFNNELPLIETLIAEHCRIRSVLAASPDLDLKIERVSIIGDGILAGQLQVVLSGLALCETVCLTLSEYENAALEDDQEQTDLKIFCSDTDDWEWHMNANRISFEQSHLNTHLWFTSIGYNIGPLILPGTSACFACLMYRGNSTSRFNSFNSTPSSNAKRRCDGDSGDTWSAKISTMMAEIACRHVAFDLIKIEYQLFHLIRPSMLFEYDIVCNQVTSHTLIQAPTCPICSI